VSAFKEAVGDIPPENIVYVDEVGIDTCIHREYGRSFRGEKVQGKVYGRKFKRVGIVAGKQGNSIVAPLEYSGTMDHKLFEWWFVNFLLISLLPGTCIVMDNASFHRKKVLLTLAESVGCTLIFLPPYSPNLNPIENFWSWLKRKLKKILPLHKTFNDALFQCFQVE